MVGEDVYLINNEIFLGKKWHQVDFSSLYLSGNDIDFVMLTEQGFKYYLPAFLNNLYDLKYEKMYFFTYLIDSLYKKRNYSDFNYLTPMQSKLIAIFLVNAANFSDIYLAQKALTSYWGSFLLV